MKKREEITKNILSKIEKGSKIRLILAPRFGKTKIAINIIKKLKPESILWVSPDKKLIEEDIPNEFIKWRAKSYIKKLKLSTWSSLKKVTGKFDLIILDEEHKVTETNTKNLLNKKLVSNTLISMTGTKSEDFSKKEIYKKLDLKILEDFRITKAVDHDILSDYDLNVVKVNMSSKKDTLITYNIKNKGKVIENKSFYTSEIDSYNYLNNKLRKAIESGKNKDIKFFVLARLRKIAKSPSKIKVVKSLLKILKGRILIFSQFQETAEEISEYFYHGNSGEENLLKFQNNEIQKLSLVNKGGTGYTYKKVDHVILVQSDSDKNGTSTQKIARALLKQKGHTTKIWILVLNNTQDEKWSRSLIEKFHPEKTTFIEEKNLINFININYGNK